MCWCYIFCHYFSCSHGELSWGRSEVHRSIMKITTGSQKYFCCTLQAWWKMLYASKIINKWWNYLLSSLSDHVRLFNIYSSLLCADIILIWNSCVCSISPIGGDEFKLKVKTLQAAYFHCVRNWYVNDISLQCVEINLTWESKRIKEGFFVWAITVWWQTIWKIYENKLMLSCY